MTNRSQLASWQALEKSATKMKQSHLRDLFAKDDARFSQFSTQIPGLLFDYSKQRIDKDVFTQLIALAKECDISAWREKMFNGEKINITENRAVLHTALRNRAHTPLIVDGENVTELVDNELAKIKLFVEKVRSGKWLGYSGKPVKDVVSIGVGGSNLGPQMATEALKALSDDTLNVHYVSNADGVQIASVLKNIDAETTLFVIASKTFTTSETMTNAKTAVDWFLQTAKDNAAIAKHFVAVSTNLEKTAEFGISNDNVFTMWDWVGGRFSLWSAIGLPIALYAGYDAFEAILEGAYEVDEHFKNAPLEQNIPLIMALLSVWNTSFLGYTSQAILPYDQALHMLPAYLQQGEMESNGKHVNFAGETVPYTTVPIIWGMTGINGQHAFYQCLHQGNVIVPADFIASIKPQVNVDKHHDILLSNFFAQTEALMNGVDEQEITADLTAKGKSQAQIDELLKHKIHQGNRPTTSMLLDSVDAKTVGRLIALYEHKIFCQGIILEICSFDQWGVELGKGLASKIEAELVDERVKYAHDSSTNGLMAYYKQHRTQ
ncbi:glucose-6-phosphate isomerase [Pseudoalteromonas nigrifaciens]|uniref:Glucose-6-phosphate isomerase n=2 Tax=Pseudoalteromonas TaxID=53246 RepID=G6PI_PSET1|nr:MULTISPECIES: glucose-6-phosphate isomerase [Pseudoalteromonas]Q3IKH4.1 RecName: Full=Glucose-6-phosphate isomerase; Short=GPI; AltName: Full=Phosphoglucose isomerase; Short=PGI; AltName: Full=Phosphohexose isomerase; Short=PHI [Pseudoalteromonas translucida TAC125]ASM53572.1 glucose-6-phosphate isomerase [Pseudoalteromonas nigrifaciens]MBH0094086.1 glucose-6-phosphate isomerase [Pseudoalteromonas sp. SCQQ13]WMS95562.1 glucose-6-phosphate isomerase [Pseudoalteromonas sp. HL-AS2]CAI86214.1 g